MKTATTSETENERSASIECDPDEGRLARLELAGVIRRARRGGLEEIVRVPPPAPEPGGDIVATVLEERRSGR
jgi:hypothetical protein